MTHREQRPKEQRIPLYIEVQVEGIFKVLADPTRLQMLKMLANEGGVCCRVLPNDTNEEQTQYGLCVQDLITHLKLPQSTVSHHLSLLRSAGLVQSVKKGLWVYYYRNEAAVNALKTAVLAL